MTEGEGRSTPTLRQSGLAASGLTARDTIEWEWDTGLSKGCVKGFKVQ